MIPKMFSQINKKTWLLTIIGVFAFIWVSDFIIHTKILAGTYEQTAALWRNKDDYKNYFGWLIWGEFWLAALFTTIFVMGYEGKGIKEGIRYGFLVGLLLISTNFVQYAIMPMPQNLMFSWIFWGIAQSIGAGIVAWWVWSKAQTWSWAT
jgi:hypothetical protein